MQPYQQSAPKQPSVPPLVLAMSVEELIEITEQMADLLLEESEYLQAMDFKKIPPLQEEKLKLTQMLETYQRTLEANPKLLSDADAGLRRRFTALNEEFQDILKENFRLNAVARAVNQRIVQAITDTVLENQRPATYNNQGATSMTGNLTMSLNLNQKA